MLQFIIDEYYFIFSLEVEIGDFHSLTGLYPAAIDLSGIQRP